MKVSDVISRARNILLDSDATSYRWSNAEMIDYINDAQRLVAVYRPDSCSASTVQTLSAGSKQSIPTGGFRLLDVVRNMASDGTTPGRAITITARDTLDRFDPNWHTATNQSAVKHFTYDERIPGQFFVYPPVSSGVKVETVYSKYPSAVSATTDDLTVQDSYFEALINYLLFRCYSKETDFAANAQLASSYLSLFASVLGIKLQKDIAFGPKVSNKGGDPNGAAAQLGGVA
jgi:hypothetical protein